MDSLMMVADFKAQFSDVLGKVRKGEEVFLGYGRRREKIAVLVPYEKYRKLTKAKMNRQAGTLAGKGEVVFGKDFKMTDEEFLGL